MGRVVLSGPPVKCWQFLCAKRSPPRTPSFGFLGGLCILAVQLLTALRLPTPKREIIFFSRVMTVVYASEMRQAYHDMPKSSTLKGIVEHRAPFWTMPRFAQPHPSRSQFVVTIRGNHLKAGGTVQRQRDVVLGVHFQAHAFALGQQVADNVFQKLPAKSSPAKFRADL